MKGPRTSSRRRAGTLSAMFVLVAAVMLAACGGSSPSPTSAASLSPAPASSESAPRGYALSAREARAVATARQQTEDPVLRSAAEIGGYIVEFTAGRAALGVYVDVRRGDAEPARRTWGWMYHAPQEDVPSYEDLRPISAGEHWALSVARRAEDAWLGGQPLRDGQPARTDGHAIVAYAVLLADDDRGFWSSVLVDARGRFVGSVGGGGALE
jgi:hypothetical protein